MVVVVVLVVETCCGVKLVCGGRLCGGAVTQFNW